ncbi:MAG: SpoIIE family protein phosphatase [Thermoflexales bacterium]|nr:SpoIIE family protein phosphatase [Thermoflexales bacterium]
MDVTQEQNAGQAFIEWGAAGLSVVKHSDSGDQYVVKEFPHGAVAAVVDGLGHGEGAAIVAKTAAATLSLHASEPVAMLLKRCHEALLRTRGVVMSLASFNALSETMTWLGVGNVSGILLRADPRANPPREILLARGGVVGYRLPTLRSDSFSLSPGDTLIFSTDGIRSGFTQNLVLNGSPQEIADRILAEYGRGTDDALALVVRYAGQPRLGH